MKKVLLLGSCGFIFSNFVRKAIHDNQPYELVCVDKCVSPINLQSKYLNPRVHFYFGDIADTHTMELIFQTEQPDIVINAAAETFVDAAIENSTPFIQTNVVGTQVIIDKCVKYKVEKLIYTSSDEIYGALKSTEDKPWTEEDTPAPRNPYSASKYAGELMIKAAAETHGLKYIITRACNNYGPRQNPRSFIPKIISSILNNTKMPVYSKGENLREWLFVGDFCTAMNLLIEKGGDNQVYNISSNYEFSNLEIFHEVCNIMGKGYDLLEFVKDRPGHDHRYAINSNKIKDLGWKTNTKFKDGLRQTTDWYQKNQWVFR